MLKIGSSPLGVYNGEAESGSSGSYSGQYQDSKGWLKLGKQDYVAPQIYWTIGNSHGNPDFAALVHSWQHDAAGKQVYAGIGAYKSDVLREIGAQVDSARAAGLSGEAFFRYEFIRTRGTLGDHFQTRALIPPMPWKDNVPPRAPSFLAASEIATNVFELEWTPPPQADDGDLARSYNVYRSVSPHIPFDDPRIIVAEVPGTTNSFIDTVRVPAGVTYYYAVRAVDKGNNEGPPSVTSNATVQELLALRGKMTDVTSLTTSVANGAGTPGLVAYRLARRTPVSLQVFRQGPGGSDSLFTTIVNRLQDGGTYVVGLGRLAFRPGVYTLRLTAGDTVLEQPLNIRP
jgi:hypothetical protein